MIARHRRLEMQDDLLVEDEGCPPKPASESRDAQNAPLGEVHKAEMRSVESVVSTRLAAVRRFQNNAWAVHAGGTSRAHSGSSFSGRLTRVLTGYFFINLASNGLRQSVTRVASVTPGSNHKS